MTGDMAKLGSAYSFAEVECLAFPEGAVFQFIPSLASICLRTEREPGRRLTRDDFDRIKANSGGIVALVSSVRDVEKSRGYEDIVTYEEYLLKVSEDQA